MRTIIRDCQAARKTIRVPFRGEVRTIVRVNGQAPDYSELLRRIGARREAMGGISETQACTRAGLTKDCIRTIRRGNAPRAETLRALAKKSLGCPPSYFLDAVGITDDDDASAATETEDHEIEQSEEMFTPGYVLVPRLLDRAAMGGVALSDADNFGEPELMPERLISDELRGVATDFLLMEVDGPSMSPILESGDRVLIDIRKKNPAQPGIFVVHEGLGFVAKWVQHVTQSDPPQVKITSENTRFDPYTILLDNARIVGRVVWYARKL